MKKRFTMVIICGMIALGAFAQKPTAVIRKASEPPVIDGEIDPVWAEADSAYNIDRSDEDEFPTLGEPGETTWQGLWDWEGIYILLRVTDDDFYPNYEAGPGEFRWEYDSPEIYFDVNYTLDDGRGPMTGETGHYQFAPEFSEAKIDGTVTTEGNGFSYAFLVDDPNYTAEYFIPFSVLLDEFGEEIYLEGDIGFDISLIDRDLGDDSANVAVWSNIGTIAGSWENMDDCGIIRFDQAGINVYVEEVNLTGGEITENNGKLQIQAEVLPENASNKNLKWTIENTTGKASIDQDGVVTAKIDGEVIVTATAVDDNYVEGTAIVEITGQIVTIRDVNVIRNGYFDQVEADGAPTGWDGSSAGPNPGPVPYVDNGIVILTPGEPDDPPQLWHYQLSQSNLDAEPDIDYIYSFVAWADDARPIITNFEDPADPGWNRYGTTTSEYQSWGDGQSDWTIDLSTEPTRYVLDVIFDDMSPTTIQKVGFQLGNSSVAMYLDSMELVSLDDYAKIEDYIPVTWIEVTGEGGATDVHLGSTLQMDAEVTPAEADYPAVKWSVVNGTGEATIDENGLLTPVSKGAVTVVAAAKDDSNVKGERQIQVRWAVGIPTENAESFRIYPNPAENELHVVLMKGQSSVSIFNSTGVKIEEVIVTGTEHTFDISSYAPGIYFIRSGNAVSKFIK